jgi:AAA+ superfamily predicted ATPase
MTDFQREIETYLRSRFTVIWVVSYEEERVIGHLRNLCAATSRRLAAWDIVSYFQPLEHWEGPMPDARDPKTALEAIVKSERNVDTVFVLKDFHACLDRQPVINRELRNLAQTLKYTRKSVVILSPSEKIPDELRDDIFVLPFPPPDMAELEGILDKLVKNPQVRVDLTDSGREKVLRSALGLSSNQAQRVFAKSIVAELHDAQGRVTKPAGTMDERTIDLITEEKKGIIRESGALEFYSPRETVADVGGLDVLKQWLRLRERAFSREARNYGLPAPKGIALIGIPGTGKSLTARMVARLWRLPLVRLDVGALFGGLVGQSEENTRRALSLVETIAPCLLWIDEMEKAFAAGGMDGGTSQRVVGHGLSWMQEKKQPVFVIGTANNIMSLPPEFLRRGRFDEVFFLDLPSATERQEIFQVHIEKRRRSSRMFDLETLSAVSEGYVGAEIEQAVIDAMYQAFNDNGRDFTTGDIIKPLRDRCPSPNRSVRR